MKRKMLSCLAIALIGVALSANLSFAEPSTDGDLHVLSDRETGTVKP